MVSAERPDPCHVGARRLKIDLLYAFPTVGLTERVWLPWTTVMSCPPNLQMCSDVIFVASALVLVPVTRNGTYCSPVFPGLFLSCSFPVLLFLVSFLSHVNNEEQQVCSACIFLSVSAPM